MPIGAKNLYVCQTCRSPMITVDLVEGVTPFMVKCTAMSNCGGYMYSNVYRVPPFYQNAPATHEWYRPEDDVIPTLTIAEQDHVRKGGLLLRRVADGSPAESR